MGADTNQNQYWIFNFTWTCVALGTDQPISGAVQASVLIDSASPVTESSRTYYLNRPTAGVQLLSVDQALLSAQQGAVAAITPGATDTQITIRKNGDYFDGGIYVVGALSAISSTTVTLAGPFFLPVPTAL